ncbi:MAG TPA: pitrilysin family protein, partial [Thermoanaerobaculia bacterium]|nr:pitrilysin family protein [Thermoanaerobaculia bacterium]
NGTTWLDRTNYFASFATSPDTLEWLLRMEADRMVNSRISSEDLDSEMTVVRNEMEMGENNPAGVMIARLFSTAYLWHNYGKSTIGSRADLENVPIERLQAFYRKYYQPDNAVLVVAGKFDEKKTLDLIAAKFGAIPRPQRKLEAIYTAEPAQDGEREVVLRRVGDVQMAAAAYHVPAGSHADAAALDVLAFVLGDTPSGRLHKALVETQKAASVFAGSLAFHDPGLLFLSVDVRKEKSLDEARGVLVETVEKLVATAPSEQEVARARDALLKNWETTLRNSERAAIELSEWAGMGDWRLLFLHRDRLEKVTPADVARVAAAYLRPENRTLGLYIPTTAPQRAEVPANPDVLALVKDYQGREALAAGEAFDPAPAAIEGRLERRQLPGGMKVALLPKDTRGDTVQLALTLRLGDEQSLRGQATPAGLAAAMLTRGTSTKTREQIQDELDRLKTQLTITGGASQVTATMETTRPNLEAALRLLAEVLRQPAFPDQELAQLKQERLAQLEDVKTDPQQRAFTLLERHLNPWPAEDPRYTASPEEDIARIQAASSDQVRGFYRDFYGASAAELALVGDFDAPQIAAQLEKLFGDWQSARPFTRLPMPYRERPAIAERVETPDKEMATFLAGQPLQLQDADPDYPALVLANFMAGGGFLNSRLATRLRQKDGLSYGAGSFFNASPFEKSARFGAFAIYAPQNREKLVAAFREEIDRMLATGFTAEEIAQAKSGWLQRQQVSRGTDRELARTLAQRDYQGRTLAWDEQLEARVQALGAEEILAAMKRHLDPAKISYVQAGDFAKGGAAPGAAATPK